MRPFFYLLLLIRPTMCLPQNSNIMYPDLFTAYKINTGAVDASSLPKEIKAEANAGIRFRSGAFQQISTLSFSAARVFRKDSLNAHLLRLLASNEKQGPFISTPRAYLNYAYELTLAPNWKAGAGIALGGIQKLYSGVVASGNTSTLVPDASLALSVHYNATALSVATHQTVNAKTRSLASELEFKRFYQFFFTSRIPVNDYIQINFNTTYRLLPVYRDDFIGGGSVLVGDIFTLGIAYRSNKEVSMFGELKLGSRKDRLSLVFNYNSTLFSTYSYTRSTVEIGAGYAVK